MEYYSFETKVSSTLNHTINPFDSNFRRDVNRFYRIRNLFNSYHASNTFMHKQTARKEVDQYCIILSLLSADAVPVITSY